MEETTKAVGQVAEAGSKFMDMMNAVFKIDAKKKIDMAKAEAESMEIISKTKMNVEARETVQRAMLRALDRELYFERNLTAIAQEALPLIAGTARPDAVTEEFLQRFGEASHHATEDDLRTMFARIMASEVNEPGTIRPGVLEIMRNLSKSDAQLIEKLNQLVWKIGTTYGIIIPNSKKQNLSWFYTVTFEQLLHLDYIGILQREADTVMQIHPQSNFGFSYQGEDIIMRNPTDHKIDVPAYILTWDGSQIMQIIQQSKNEEYLKDSMQSLEQSGLKRV